MQKYNVGWRRRTTPRTRTTRSSSVIKKETKFEKINKNLLFETHTHTHKHVMAMEYWKN
jgi:hypothetical protein